MPLTGVHINQEFSTTVLPQSITLSFWSVLLEVAGKSKTLGESDGENKVLSDLLEVTLVVSAPMQVSFLNFDQSVSFKHHHLFYILEANCYYLK